MKPEELYEYLPLPIDSYSVAVWSEGDVEKGDPLSQVHIVLNVGGGIDTTFVMRIKSRRAIDDLIMMLAKERDEVWPLELDEAKQAEREAEERLLAADYQAWLSENFSERELKLIQNCRDYADGDPGGLPGHQLMLLVAKLEELVGIDPSVEETEEAN